MSTFNCKLHLNFRGWHIRGKHWHTLELPKTGSSPLLYVESSQFVNKMSRAIKSKTADLSERPRKFHLNPETSKAHNHLLFPCLLKAGPNLLHQSCYSRSSKSKDCSSFVRHIPASCFLASCICFRNMTWKEVLQTTRQGEAKQQGVFSASLLIQKHSSQVKI